MHPKHAIVYDDDRDGAEQRLRHRTAPATQTYAAKHGPRNDDEFRPDAGGQRRGSQSCRVEERREASQCAGYDVRQEYCAPHMNAGVERRSARSAHREYVPSELHPRQEYVSADCHHRGHNEAGGHTEQSAVTEKVEDVAAIYVAAGD